MPASVGGLAILLPVAQAIQLKRVDVLSMDGEELVDENIVAFAADAVEVPDRMVEDDEHLRDLVQLGEDVAEKVRLALGDRNGGEGAEPIHPLLAGSGGQVVDADVKGALIERHRPFDRDGNVARRGDRAKQQRRVDVVVIGERDQRRNLEAVLDLRALEVEGEPRGQRRGPIAVGIVGPDARTIDCERSSAQRMTGCRKPQSRESSAIKSSVSWD